MLRSVEPGLLKVQGWWRPRDPVSVPCRSRFEPLHKWKDDRTRSRSNSMLLLVLIDLMLEVFAARIRKARLHFHMLLDVCAMAVGHLQLWSNAEEARRLLWREVLS